jgi:hypothetical protein
VLVVSRRLEWCSYRQIGTPIVNPKEKVSEDFVTASSRLVSRMEIRVEAMRKVKEEYDLVDTAVSGEYVEGISSTNQIPGILGCLGIVRELTIHQL